MSYLKKIEYRITPMESYQVVRNCSGCGEKANYSNTKRFRVNANGNKVDVWLIYQCEKCKHTLNLTIYERRKPESIPRQEYQSFLSNDERLARQYGVDKEFFARNKAQLDTEGMKYKLELKAGEEKELGELLAGAATADTAAVPMPETTAPAGIRIAVENPCRLKLRADRIMAEVLGITRSRAKKLEKSKAVEVNMETLAGTPQMCIYNIWVRNAQEVEKARNEEKDDKD